MEASVISAFPSGAADIAVASTIDAVVMRVYKERLRQAVSSPLPLPDCGQVKAGFPGVMCCIQPCVALVQRLCLASAKPT